MEVDGKEAVEERGDGRTHGRRGDGNEDGQGGGGLRIEVMRKATNATIEEEVRDAGGGDGDAADPQGPDLHGAIIGAALFLGAWALRRVVARRPRRRAVACCWRAGRRRKWRRDEIAKFRVGDECGKIAIPAPGAVKARGWALAGSGTEPPLLPAPVASRHRAGSSETVSRGAGACALREHAEMRYPPNPSQRSGWHGRRGGGDAVRHEKESVDDDDDARSRRRHDEEEVRMHSAAFEPFQRKGYKRNKCTKIWFKLAAAIILLLGCCQLEHIERANGNGGARPPVKKNDELICAEARSF